LYSWWRRAKCQWPASHIVNPSTTMKRAIGLPRVIRLTTPTKAKKAPATRKNTPPKIQKPPTARIAMPIPAHPHDRRSAVVVGSKVGRFQSGSGLQFQHHLELLHGGALTHAVVSARRRHRVQRRTPGPLEMCSSPNFRWISSAASGVGSGCRFRARSPARRINPLMKRKALAATGLQRRCERCARTPGR